MTADDVCKVMAGMRAHGVARVKVGDMALELGAQAPSELMAQALATARGQLEDEQRAPTLTPGPAASARTAAPLLEEDPHAPPRTPPAGPPRREALLELDDKDPLFYQLEQKAEESAR